MMNLIKKIFSAVRKIFPTREKFKSMTYADKITFIGFWSVTIPDIFQRICKVFGDVSNSGSEIIHFNTPANENENDCVPSSLYLSIISQLAKHDLTNGFIDFKRYRGEVSHKIVDTFY